ncbi:MAG: UTP--glucose-1-phosphate uridylyltransferase, partial [bacterium]
MTHRAVTRAVIPAAGLGTRMLPATKAIPKEMLPLVDKPSIQYVVEEAVAAGCTDILIIVGRGKDAIIDHFDRAPELETLLRKNGKTEDLERVTRVNDLAHIHFVRQQEALGLGHAVLQARSHVGDAPFCLLLGDDLVDAATPCLQPLIEAYRATGLGTITLETLTPAQTTQKGVVALDELGKLGREQFAAAGLLPEDYVQLIGMVEKPPMGSAPSDQGILGRYCLPGSIFPLLATTRPGTNGEIQLTDALLQL